jgi:hydroxylamine dehydrogenase
MEFVPEVKELIEEGKRHGKNAAVTEIEKSLDEILNSELHQWFLGKMDPEEARMRKEAAEKFRSRYSTK